MQTKPAPLTRPTTRAEAVSAGWTRRRLARAVEDGRLRRVFHNVYVDADVPDSPELRAAAAGLVLPDRMVVCDRSAAWLHGIDHYEPTALDVPPDLEVVARSGQRTTLDGTRGGVRTLAPEDVMLLDGVAVTTPLRTAADLACRRGRLAAAAVLDQLARHHGVTSAQLRSLLPRYAGRRGVTQLRELAVLVSPLAESPRETWLFRLIVDHHLPPPQRQVVVELEEGTFRLDLAYPHLRIAIEYDGEEHHSSAADRARDAWRRQALQRAGWVVIAVRKEGMSGAGLDTWMRQLRSAVRERRGDGVPRYARGEDYRRS